MNRIAKSLLNEFIAGQEIDDRDESKNFEKFCNYSIVSNEYPKTFDINDVTVGSGNDTGIDGMAIIVNGVLISSVDEANDLWESNGYLEITYVFTQSKTSPNFSTADMRIFFAGIRDFFSETPRLVRNSDITDFSEISEYLFSKASDFKSNPNLKAFYVSTGSLQEDQNISATIADAKVDLERYGIFEEISIEVLGVNELIKLYRKTKNPIAASFTFSDKVILPDTEGVEQSYYGVLPFSEFRKILIDENDNIQCVFDDNVRDYQGDNAVNKEIKATLSGDNPNLFSVLNNGVTVVANDIKVTGNAITITDYQIVNGCQTSNVLYWHRELEGVDDITIPLRLIITKDNEVKSLITVSTNNQTAIKKDQLSAMSDFQKNLELYYTTITGDGQLYYERRAKQYNSDPSVIKRRIITTANQIKSFSSMVYKDPHMVTTYYGKLAEKMGVPNSGVCNHDHQ